MPSDRSLAARDRALPGLATVLDATAAASLTARVLPTSPRGTPSLTYTRYKPGASCLVALRYETDDDAAFVTLKAVSLDAGDKWTKYRDSAGVYVDDALRIAVRQFPHDGELRGPRWLFDPARHAEVRSALALPASTTFEVIAYKPERRLVVRALVDGTPVAVIKCHDRGAFTHALAAQRALAAVADLPVRAATTWNERRGTLVAPWVAGRVLDVAQDDPSCFALAGAALARIHAAPLDVRTGETDAEADVALHRIAQSVSGWLPASAEPFRHLLAHLARHRRHAVGRHTAIHGDFYAKQVLVTSGGVSLLDFDECVIGDPHIDLANFAAHLERDVLRRTCTRERADLVLDALLAGYTAARPLDRRQLGWRTAEALIRLTPHPFRHRDPDWSALTLKLVSAAQARLDRIAAPVAPRQLASVAAVSPDAWRAWQRLQADDALAFAAPLASPDIATRALGTRLFSPTQSPVDVRSTTVMRHKVGRRCMIAIDLVHAGVPERWLGKIRARGLDARAAAVHRMLWDAGATTITAEPLGTVDAMRMTLQRAIDGDALLPCLQRDPSPAHLGERVAACVSSLHALACEPGRAWTLDDEHAVLRTRLAALTSRHPGHADAIARLVAAVGTLAPAQPAAGAMALIHRDLYHDQVLLTDTQCRLIDLDLCARGDAALDVGNLVAHLIEAQWRHAIDASRVHAFSGSFCAAVLARAERPVHERSVVQYALLSLIRLTDIASQMPDRAAHLAGHLDRVQALHAALTQRPTLTTLLESTR